MSAAAAANRARGAGPAPFALDGADRLETLFAPIRGMPRAMSAVLVCSAAAHLVIVGTAIVSSRAPLSIPETLETTVEVVQEVPKAAQPKPAAGANVPKLDLSKLEPPNAEASKVETPRGQALPKIAAVKPDAKASEERAALQKELAALRAQQAELTAPSAAAQSPADAGMGPMPNSFQAVALPSSGQGVGEAMGYQDIVFSQLAKAKGLGRRQGKPGTTGVRFDVDAAGGLADAEIVRPSGIAALDAEALDIVRRAAPFPPPPPGARRNFTANVNFVVQP